MSKHLPSLADRESIASKYLKSAAPLANPLFATATLTGKVPAPLSPSVQEMLLSEELVSAHALPLIRTDTALESLPNPDPA